MNWSAAVAWLDTPPTVTVTVTVPLPGGEITPISPGRTNSTSARFPPDVTVTAQPATPAGQDRPVPVMTTGVSPYVGPLSGRSEVITGPLTEIDSAALAVIAGLSASVTVTVKSNVPYAAGVPEITPAVLSDSPAGSDPDVTPHGRAMLGAG